MRMQMRTIRISYTRNRNGQAFRHKRGDLEGERLLRGRRRAQADAFEFEHSLFGRGAAGRGKPAELAASRQHAIFGQPEVGAGIVPGGGASERLPRLAGRDRALEVILSSND